MTENPYLSFTRYLAAKKSVDDRALNSRVWQVLKQSIHRGEPDRPVNVLEIGAGIGTMIERIAGWDLLDYADYIALDNQAENIAIASQRLPQWANQQGFTSRRGPRGEMVFERPGKKFTICLETSDLFNFIAREGGKRNWELLVAHAFLDLMNIPIALPQILSLAEAQGLFYFSINFDGATILEPPIEPGLDERILRLYHRSMDERMTGGMLSGDSRAGRHLFALLRQAGATLLEAGASDWVVFPGPRGYPEDEAYFLHFIVETIHQALLGHPELDQGDFEAWVSKRHAQVERQELVYIAHQLDFVGKTPDRITPTCGMTT